MDDASYNAADADAVHEAERRQKQQQEAELRDLRTVMELPEGRRFLWRLLGQCGVESPTYTPGADVGAMQYLEGRRSIGIALMGSMESASTELFAGMLYEQWTGKTYDGHDGKHGNDNPE